jgi:hypothetical protein
MSSATVKLSICNLALTLLGQRVVTALNDTTENGRRMIVLYDILRDSVLSSYPWNFAKRKSVGVLSVADDITGWDYLYAYPTDCLNVIRPFDESTIEEVEPVEFEVLSAPLPTPDDWDATTAYVAGDYVTYGTLTYKSLLAGTNKEPDVEVLYWVVEVYRTWLSGTTYAIGDYVVYLGVTYRCIQAGQGKIPDTEAAYWLVEEGQLKVIATNLEDAQIEYIYRQVEATQYDNIFIEAFAYRLAAALAQPLSGDKTLGDSMLQKSMLVIAAAKNKHSNEQYKKRKQTSGMISARG